MITIQVIERTQRHVETNEISSYQVFEVDVDGVKSYAPLTAKFTFDLGYIVDTKVNPA